MASVVRQVSVGQSEVSNPGVGWSCTVISIEIVKGGSEFRDVLQCFNELKLADRCYTRSEERRVTPIT